MWTNDSGLPSLWSSLLSPWPWGFSTIFNTLWPAVTWLEHLHKKKKCSCLPYKVIVWLPSEMALTIFNWILIHVEMKLAWHEDSKLDEKEHLYADVTSCSTPKRICAVKTTNLIKNLEKECITYSTESLHGLATNNL